MWAQGLINIQTGRKATVPQFQGTPKLVYCLVHCLSAYLMGQQLAYVIVGSHNLSIAAWGGPPRKGSQAAVSVGRMPQGGGHRI
eukprot:1147157-Pelagomonas_calceolata.AAC.5